MATCPIQDFLNPYTPLWLSALNPTSSPANLTVSSLTVASSGGIILTNDQAAAPNTVYGGIDFLRQTGSDSQLVMNVSKNVPGIAPDSDFITVTQAAKTQYDDLALRGLQVFGPQVTNPLANTGAAGYITQGTLPYSINVETAELQTNTLRASAAVLSTLNVSSIFIGGGEVVPDPLVISSIQTSSITANSITTSTINASFGSFSTASISSFVLPSSFIFGTLTGSTINVALINASTMNISSISTGIIEADVGTFSTLNAPGFGGGSTINTSTVTTSSITTGLLSTTIGVIKEVFTSSMTFNATLSPNFDLGLGGIIGGLAGGFGANALSVGLGAAGLGTGIAALALSRQSGGINPGVFQTINGTSQLQFSTLGASNITILTLTDSANPDTTPGNTNNVSTVIQAGTYCVRTISDPLNLPNSSGTSGLGIQGFSQWRQVYQGRTQLINNRISSISGNSIDFGGNMPIPGIPNDPMIFNTGPNTGANIGYFQFNGAILGTTLGLGPTFGTGGNGDINAEQAELAQTIRVPETYTSTIYAYNYPTQSFLSTLNIFPGLTTSTISVSSFTIGNAQFRNLNASTINTSTLNATGLITYNTQTGDSINTRIFNATQTVGTTALTTQNLSTQTASISSISGLSSINGAVYPPPIPAPAASVPTGTIIVFAAANAPTGYLVCDGGYYGQTVYPALFAVIGINYGGQFAGQFAVPDLRAKTVFGASAPTFVSPYATFAMVATTFTTTIATYPGGSAPNGITGRQALTVESIAGGYELAVGMRVNANTGADQTVRVIIDILNYRGNSTASFSYPNVPVLILNSPFTIDLPVNTVFTVTPVENYKYTLGQFTADNFTTQTQYQVAGHTHTTLQPGGSSSQISGGQNRSGDPNIAGPQTTLNTQNYYYALGSVTVGQPPTVFDIPTAMNTSPSCVAMNWIIKT